MMKSFSFRGMLCLSVVIFIIALALLVFFDIPSRGENGQHYIAGDPSHSTILPHRSNQKNNTKKAEPPQGQKQAKHNKESVSALLANLEDLANAGNATEKIEHGLHQLAMLSPYAAMQFLLDGPASVQSFNYYSLVMDIYTSRDIDAAGQVISTMAQGELKNALTVNYLAKLTHKNPEQALSWAESIGEQNLKAMAQQSVIDTWLEQAPRAALMAISMNPTLDSKLIAQSVSDAAYTLARPNPEAASDLLYQYADKIQPAIASGIARAMQEKDPDMAAKWLSSIPDANTRQVAAKRLANQDCHNCFNYNELTSSNEKQ